MNDKLACLLCLLIISLAPSVAVGQAELTIYNVTTADRSAIRLNALVNIAVSIHNSGTMPVNVQAACTSGNPREPLALGPAKIIAAGGGGILSIAVKAAGNQFATVAGQSYFRPSLYILDTTRGGSPFTRVFRDSNNSDHESKLQIPTDGSAPILDSWMECSASDQDGDGHIRMRCGGSDCDDTDPDRFPGNAEVCDANHHDEDCDPSTFGARDQDYDESLDASCCNRSETGSWHCGTDCDDRNPAIVAQAQICLDDSTVRICNPSAQPNGVLWENHSCLSVGAQRCQKQPNGTGICI